MKYSDVLELIIFVLLFFMINSFVQNHYSCEISYTLPMLEYNIYIDNVSHVYYNKEETLFILHKNMDSDYVLQNLSCKLRFK